MKVAGVHRALLDWFERHARPLPWREQPTPYHTWVSEIMLQQTQAATVVPYYLAFIERFPDVRALAAAPREQVLKAWEGLGYYRRAHNLHRAAQIVVEQHDGELPGEPDALLALPGIGRYTAGAIQSLAFGQRAPILDGNVKRVLSRLYDLEVNVDTSAGERQLWALAGELVDPEQPGAFNEALMELGATICTPQNPHCLLCPLQETCLAQARGTQYERPVRKPRRRTPHFDVVAAVVWHATRPDVFLIAQRPAEAMLGGLWEFPGGKQEAGESRPQALRRELREELDIEVAVGEQFTQIEHAYTHFRITLHVFHARHVGGEPRRLGVADWRWVTLAELDQLPFARSDRHVIAALQAQAEERAPTGAAR